MLRACCITRIYIVVRKPYHIRLDSSSMRLLKRPATRPPTTEPLQAWLYFECPTTICRTFCSQRGPPRHDHLPEVCCAQHLSTQNRQQEQQKRSPRLCVAEPDGAHAARISITNNEQLTCYLLRGHVIAGVCCTLEGA